MVLIKNVTITSKGNQYLMAQHYTILTKVINETTWVHLLKSHNKLSSVQSAFKKVNSFSFLAWFNVFFIIYT
jgi:hypothetical protein